MTRERKEDPLTSSNFIPACDDAVAKFLGGDFGRFDEITTRLETLKVGTVRSILNREQAKLLETEGDDFNAKFNLVNNGDDDEEEKDEDAP